MINVEEQSGQEVAMGWGDTAAAWRKRMDHLNHVIIDEALEIAQRQMLLNRFQAERQWLIMQRGKTDWVAKWAEKYGMGYGAMTDDEANTAVARALLKKYARLEQIKELNIQAAKLACQVRAIEDEIGRLEAVVEQVPVAVAEKLTTNDFRSLMQ